MRILITSSYNYWGDFKPTDLRDPKCITQVGGGETAMVSVSRELAALGHEVIVFYNVAYPTKYEGVDYLPSTMFIPLITTLEHDVLVSWDDVYAFRYGDRAKVHIMAYQLNHAFVGIFDQVIDRYFHPSNWHAERYAHMYPEITKSKQRAQITNGIDPVRYTQQVTRDPHRVIYSSSPDRGLHHLLEMWPAIKAADPLANLHVFYDMDKWLNTVINLEAQGYSINTADVAHRLIAAKEVVKDLDVTFYGGIGQWQLAAEQLKSGLMVYPCDPVQPTEGFSMSCLEGITAGCSLVTTNADALGELWTSAPGTTLLPLPIEPQVWIDTIVKKLIEPTPHEPLLSDKYIWRAVALNWQKEILQCL